MTNERKSWSYYTGVRRITKKEAKAMCALLPPNKGAKPAEQPRAFPCKWTCLQCGARNTEQVSKLHEGATHLSCEECCWGNGINELDSREAAGYKRVLARALKRRRHETD